MALITFLFGLLLGAAWMAEKTLPTLYDVRKTLTELLEKLNEAQNESRT